MRRVWGLLAVLGCLWAVVGGREVKVDVGAFLRSDAAVECRIRNPLAAHSGQKLCLDQAVKATVTRRLRVVEIPSAREPVVFYHARKCGGTSLRRLLLASAQAAGLQEEQVLLPGVGRTRYDVYEADVLTPAQAERVAVAGAHWSWGAHNRIDRVISCYYHRFYPFMQPAPIHMWELAPETLARLLATHADTWGDGCLNELLRLFSGMGDSHAMNVLGATPQSDVQDERFAVHQSIMHMAQCAVAQLPSRDAPAPTVVSTLRRWHPWLLPGPLPHVLPVPSQKPRDAVEQLRAHPQHWDVVWNLTRLERRVYDAARVISGWQNE